MVTLTFPAPTGSGIALWTGESFSVEGTRERVLSYDIGGFSSWTDELTHLHEDTAGGDYFIDVASRAYAMKEIRRALAKTPSTILEVGCSSGFLLRDMTAQLPQHIIVGTDFTINALKVLGPKFPTVPLLRFDLSRCPLPDAFANVVVLLNVLEHVEDDKSAVANLFRITAPGGSAIIEVPAGSALFDVYDRALMHFKRYEMSRLIDLCQGAGFTIERRSHLGFFLYPAFYFTKRLNQFRFRNVTGDRAQSAVAKMINTTGKWNPLMHRIMRAEDAVRDRMYLPFGIRCLVTCRKPS